MNPGYPDSTDSPGLFALARTCGHWSSVGTAAEVLESEPAHRRDHVLKPTLVETISGPDAIS